MGTVKISISNLDSEKASFAMQMRVPTPMTITTDFLIDGNTTEGTSMLGMSGNFPMTATRRST